MDREINLRLIVASDLDRAALIHRQAFEPLGERPWTGRDMAELLASPGVAGLLVEAEGGAEGFALWRTAADEAELLTVAVRAGSRRRGIGRALLDAVADRARQAGATRLFLEVGADNPVARALYAQAGFLEVGRRAGYYRRGTGAADALVLRLWLTSGGS